MAANARAVHTLTARELKDEPIESPSGEDIANLAYSLWQAREDDSGSSDEDWFRAEAQLRA